MICVTCEHFSSLFYKYMNVSPIIIFKTTQKKLYIIQQTFHLSYIMFKKMFLFLSRLANFKNKVYKIKINSENDTSVSFNPILVNWI